MKGIKQVWVLILAAMAAGVCAEDVDADSGARRANVARCEARLAERLAAHGDDARYFVSRGLLADRDARTITLDAFTTGVGPTDIAEFILITENSGHAYEALLTTFAGSDVICQAIEWIGVPRGRSVNYAKLIFWPKGERLQGTVAIGEASAVPLDSLVTDTGTGRPLDTQGFIYTGDRRNEEGAFIGDAYGPGSVISTYNEPITVMDVPRRAAQSEVYEKYRVSTNFVVQADVWAEIVLRPEPRPEDAPTRVRDVHALFSPDGVATDGGEPEPVRDAVAGWHGLAAAGHDVYVTLRWDGALTLGRIRDYCRLLDLLDNDAGVRIEPPEPGDPYYRAFLPQEAWREREGRFTQPCELRVNAEGGADVVAIEEVWSDDAIKPALNIETIPAVTPETLPGVLAEKGPRFPVLLIFAPASLEYARLKPYLGPILESHPNVHLFLD